MRCVCPRRVSPRLADVLVLAPSPAPPPRPIVSGSSLLSLACLSASLFSAVHHHRHRLPRRPLLSHPCLAQLDGQPERRPAPGSTASIASHTNDLIHTDTRADMDTASSSSASASHPTSTPSSSSSTSSSLSSPPSSSHPAAPRLPTLYPRPPRPPSLPSLPTHPSLASHPSLHPHSHSSLGVSAGYQFPDRGVGQFSDRGAGQFSDRGVGQFSDRSQFPDRGQFPERGQFPDRGVGLPEVDEHFAAGVTGEYGGVDVYGQTCVPSLIPPGIDPAHVDMRTFYPYVPSPLLARSCSSFPSVLYCMFLSCMCSYFSSVPVHYVRALLLGDGCSRRWCVWGWRQVPAERGEAPQAHDAAAAARAR